MYVIQTTLPSSDQLNVNKLEEIYRANLISVNGTEQYHGQN